MTEHDKMLVAQARNKNWWEINESEAETKEGADALHQILMRDYHRDELRSFGIC